MEYQFCEKSSEFLILFLILILLNHKGERGCLPWKSRINRIDCTQLPDKNEPNPKVKNNLGYGIFAHPFS